MNAKKNKGLGRGLDALLGADPTVQTAPEALANPSLPVDALYPGRYQPRSRMDEGALHELAASISVHGLIQPILVRPDGSGRFEIIAGERRWRAAQLAGLDQVPVIQREVADEQALSIALIENIQREDLNPLEEAQAIQRLIDEFHFTHERCAEAIGRSRSATSNLLRLLNLAESVQGLLLAGDLDMGHARALLAVEPGVQILLANRIVAERLTVRETERLIANWQRDRETIQSPARRRVVAPDQDLERFSQQLSDALATRVEIAATARGRGRLVLYFNDADGFEALLARLKLDSVLER
jgi:ParB family chromosome partitioning protein